MTTTDYPTKVTRYRELIAVGLTCILGWLFTWLATVVFKDYAFALFVWLPLVMGAVSTMIHAYKNPAKRSTLRNIAYCTLGVFCFGLLFFAWEGVICMIMAAPIGMFFTWIGFLIGYSLCRTKITGDTPFVIVLLILSVPSLMAFEDSVKTTENIRTVTTSIEINASPDIVWKHVASFPQLKDPTELIFKAGIAYPINATIQGKGVGAIRHCNFSTGSFEEPITLWDEPRLLRFSVTNNPETMKELSFYDIKPNHIHGYWVSKQGEFKLIPLTNGKTLLRGTTWYVNKIEPDLYWKLWSDYIVHKIHTRVLEHIKLQAETTKIP